MTVALEAGALFASFHVDISGIEQELAGIEERFERLGRDSVTGLGEGMQLAAALAQAGVSEAFYALGSAGAQAASRALSHGAGAAIGQRFGAGLADGLLSEAASVSAAAESLGQRAADALRTALPGQSGAASTVYQTAGTAAAAASGGTAEGAGSAVWAERVARVIASALEGVSVRMDGERVGALVTPAVSANIARQANARRYGTA